MESILKNFLLFFLLLFNGLACAAPQSLMDVKGHVHYTGLIPRNVPLVGGNYFTPSDELVKALPDKYDSRSDVFVAPIKDQGQCGSCWSFSMTKTLESARLANTKPYVDLAEQDGLVNSGMEGCNGGYMDATYWVNHGLATESDCPYKANDSYKCTAKPFDHGLAWGFVGAEGRAPTVDELKAAIYKYKVISITVAAGGSDWDGSNNGKMTSCRNTGVNHMVNLVGYDCTGTLGAIGPVVPNKSWWPWPWPRPKPPKPPVSKCTFIGANSWGLDWGDKGFFYAAQGCNEMASTADSALWISYQP